MSHESPQDLERVSFWTRRRVWLTSVCAKVRWLINIPRNIEKFKHQDEKRKAIWSILHGENEHPIELPDQTPLQKNEELTRLVLQSSNFEVRRKVFKELGIKLPLWKLVGLAGLTMLVISILFICLCTVCANGCCLGDPTAQNYTNEENLTSEMQTTITLPGAGNNSSPEVPYIPIQDPVEPSKNRTPEISENSGDADRRIKSEGLVVTSSIPPGPRPNPIPSDVCRKPGTSMFKFLNLPIPLGAYECEVIRKDRLNPDDTRQSTRVDKHHCIHRHRSCYFSTATIFVNLFDTSVLAANAYLKVLKVQPRPNCEALQTGTLIKPTVFNGLLMLQIELKYPEECRDLYLYISLMEMPRLSSLLLNNIIVSETSWEPLRRILEKPSLKNFSFNNSICDFCSFDGIDAGKFNTAHFLWRNGHEMNVTRVVKQFIDQASNLTELRWNSPIPVRELRRTFQKMPKLKVAELTVELEQVGGKAQFNLSLTEDSNLESLHINLVVKNQGIHDDSGVEISLRQFERTGQKLSRIHLHATHAANILRPVMLGECWSLEIDDNDTTVKCTKQANSLGA